MSPIQQKPILHGRDHLAGGPDPIPGIENFGGGGGGHIAHRLGATENRWYVAGQGPQATSSNTGSTTANLRALWPFIPSRDMTLDRIGVYVVSGAEIALSKVRVGMYTDDGNLYPDALLFDAGELTTSSSGAKLATISEALTAATVYWAAIHYSHASLGLRSAQMGDCLNILGWDEPTGSSPTYGMGWQQSTAYAVLPDPYPAGATAIATTATHLASIFLRCT